MTNGGEDGVRPCERERARERREEPGESEREQGGGVASSRGIEARRGGQAGRERGGVARWRARAPATLPSLCRGEDNRGGRRAGPHREEPR